MSMSGLSAFLTATGALPPAGLANNLISERKTILSAFSTLDLELQKGPNGEVVVNNKSAARDLLDARKHEKQQESLYEQKAELHAKQVQETRKPAPVVTALTQALDSFAADTDDRFLPKASTLPSSKKGRNVSRRARQRHESNKEKMENYSSKIKTKSTMQVKRAERKEKYKHIY
ncbi:hypothetical protein H310_11946 [Aphanomyces invadans]|nr:hypothetical protein H310_11946 [Aphanomyces invadans]ETV94287.1 hypothetical protein H310_11946 [Aphanomyces invadans]|eukprot:XP_008877049.1 hypothetical protein H310_11946 [Aphanomyces invadans]